MILLGASAVVGAAHIIADHKQWTGACWVLKPLTLVLLMAFHVQLGGLETELGQLLLAALVFSMIGDTVLMLPGKPIMAGLSAFLVAHVFYIASFGFAAVPMLLIAALVIWNAGVAYLLLAHVGKVLIPGLVYFGALNAMAIAAWSTGNPLLGIAGLLFLLSDSVLAFDHFRKPFWGGHGIVLLTYYGSQGLMVLGFSQL